MSVKTLTLVIAVAAGTIGFTGRADAQVVVEPPVSTSYYTPASSGVFYSGPLIHYPDPQAYYYNYPYYTGPYARYYVPDAAYLGYPSSRGGFSAGYGWGGRRWR